MPDREKVIKGAEEILSYVLPDEKDTSGIMVKVGWVRDTLALLKEHEADGNKWIKCSDEMPEEQETIFAKFKGTDKWSPAMFAQSSEDVRVVIVFADGTRRVSHSHTIDGKWECEKSPLKRTVTHWMPNPELPKEGQ